MSSTMGHWRFPRVAGAASAATATPAGDGALAAAPEALAGADVAAATSGVGTLMARTGCVVDLVSPMGAPHERQTVASGSCGAPQRRQRLSSIPAVLRRVRAPAIREQ